MSQPTQGIGIKSLAQRLEAIENTIPEVKNNSFEPSFIAHINQKQAQSDNIKKQNKYLQIKNNYIEQVNRWVTEPLKNLTKVIEITVHFVEEHAGDVSRLFGVVVKGDAKLQFAFELISLIIDFTKSLLDSEFVKNAIDHFCIIMNERKTLKDKSIENNPSPKRRKDKPVKLFRTFRSSLKDTIV
jgi:hypothetical protein